MRTKKYDFNSTIGTYLLLRCSVVYTYLSTYSVLCRRYYMLKEYYKTIFYFKTIKTCKLFICYSS